MSILSETVGAISVKNVTATGANDVTATSHEGAEGAYGVNTARFSFSNSFMFKGQPQLPQAPQEPTMSGPLVPKVPAPLVPKVPEGARRCQRRLFTITGSVARGHRCQLCSCPRCLPTGATMHNQNTNNKYIKECMYIYIYICMYLYMCAYHTERERDIYIYIYIYRPSVPNVSKVSAPLVEQMSARLDTKVPRVPNVAAPLVYHQ